MLKRALAVAAMLCAVLHGQSAAQGIIGQGIDLCEITLCCKAEVGVVDPCAFYWTFKKVNPGDIVRVVNTDPAACTLAVTSNLERLAEDFGGEFEISVPTDALAQALSVLSVPKGEALFATTVDEAALAENQELIPAIGAAIVRYPQLGRDWLEYLRVTAETEKWVRAGQAAEELSVLADGLIVHLGTGGNWPTLREFAPTVWRLLICKHGRPNEIVSLEQRLAAGSTDPARNFAFLDELAILMVPFNSRPTSLALESIASPFFTEPLAEVNRRKRESLFASSATYELKVQVDRLTAAIAAYAAERQLQQQARKSTLDANLAAQRAEMAMLHDALANQQGEVDAAENALQQANSELEAGTVALSQAEAARQDSQTALLAARARRDALSNALDLAYDASDRSADTLDAALAALNEVGLNCAGTSYDACTDSAAKLAYDKATYQANQAVNVARTAFAAALSSAETAAADLFEAEKHVDEQQARVLFSAEAVADALNARGAAEIAVADTTARLQTLKLEAAPVQVVMARLLSISDRMEQCVALTSVSKAKKVCVDEAPLVERAQSPWLGTE